MIASKENARKAIEALSQLNREMDEDPDGRAQQFVEQFLLAAEAKLPTQAAFDREKDRIRKPKRTKLANG